jgi:DNA-binding CsgD family transcriptional regulator
MPLDGLKSAEQLAANKPHGTRIKYMGGCRCLPCRAANSSYSVMCDARKRRGESNGLVDAAPVVEHIRKLSKQGAGYKAVCETAGVGKSSVMMAMQGKRKKMRAAHTRAILAVTADMAIRDHALIPAKATMRRIQWLLNEGLTRKEIARRLGYKSPALQITKGLITARNASRIERLVNQLRLGE